MKCQRTTTPRFRIAVIPAKAGLRRQDATANIDEVDGSKGALQEQRVIHLSARKIKMDPGLHRDDDQKQEHLAARFAGACLAVLLALSTPPAIAATPPTHVHAPPDLHQRVGFDQELGAQVPLDTVFHDASGKAIHLRDLLHGKPVLLVPGYFTCKTLCSVVRTGVAKGVRGTGFTPGTQFDVVLVSIDPHETPADARHAQQMDTANHPGAGVAQWHYLTGPQASIAPLMHGIGFRYMFDARSDQFDHATGIVVLTPDGKVSQYLFGVKFPPETLRLALVDASHGAIGNLIDRLELLCCQYDTSTGRYTLTIHRIMQGLGISFAVLLAGFVVFLRRAETHRKEAPR
jgi:protein SCO1/2